MTAALSLAVAIVRNHAADGDEHALRHYLDGLGDDILCAVATLWPSGRRSAPLLAKVEIRAAVRRRRQARGWTDWPAPVHAAAAELARAAASGAG